MYRLKLRESYLLDHNDSMVGINHDAEGLCSFFNFWGSLKLRVVLKGTLDFTTDTPIAIENLHILRCSPL